MSVILIQNASGDSSIRELSKQLPVAVGRHSSNDIQVSDPGVEVLHCRLSWNSRAYEVIAGTQAGVDVNGTLVPNAILTPGDCIQVGSLGIFYYESSEQLDAALRGETIEAEESPADEYDQVEAYVPRDPKQQNPGTRKKKKKEKDSRSPVTSGKKQQLPTQSTFHENAPPKKLHSESSPKEIEPEELTAYEKPPPKKVLADPKEKRSGGLFGAREVRPGEQDLLKSPLVLSLGIGTAVLIMISLALWFVIGRDSSHKAYQLAIDEMDQKRYTQAIAQLGDFIKNYPSHRFASSARHALGLSQAEQPLAGAAPDWVQGLESLNHYIDERKRDKDFSEMAPKVADLAERIAKGAAESAGVQKKPDLLKTSGEATRLLQTYSPTDTPPKQALLEIDGIVQKAQAAIRQHDTFQAALVQIDQELKAQHPFAAFEVRRKLLLKYPALESDAALRSRLKVMLETERKLTSKTAVEQAAQTTEPASKLEQAGLLLLRHSRTRSDIAVSGTNVFCLVHGTCLAADSATGAIQWRRVVGLETPFAPQPVSLDVLGLLLFDVRHNELLLVKQRDGGLIWRQTLPDPASAAPLVHAGQIFIPTRAGKLCQLDLVSGKLLSALAFSQRLAASPVLVQNGERLIVAGERAVLYTLNYRPLECQAVTYSGHSAGSIQAPLLKMGDFLLTTENDRQDSAQLRVWNLAVGDQPLVPLALARVLGQARETAMLRGKQLIVPTSPERISSFTVSDEKGGKTLTAAGTYAIEPSHGSPISVTLGPDDELWMTSSSLRRFTIGPDSLIPDKGQLSLGVSTQPVQVVEQNLFATSRVPSNSAISFLAADRREMVSQWQLVLGGRALAAGLSGANDGSIPLLIDTGDVFSISAAKVQAGGLDSRPVATLSLPAGLRNPLQGTLLANGRLAAWCDGAQSTLWQLNGDGVITRETKLPGQLEAPPILMSGGVLLPLAGKLKLIEAPGFSSAVEDLMPPIDPQRSTHWRSVVPIDEKQFIAVNDQGRILRGQVRTEPVPHLAEVTSIDLKQRVDQTPVAVGSTIFLATEKSLRGLDMGTLEARGEVQLVDLVSQGPWAVGKQLVLVCGRDQLVVVDIEPTLTVRWTQKLQVGSLTGAPILRKEQLVLATFGGEITIRNLPQGELIKSMDLGQTLTFGPFLVQDQVVVATQDGTVKSLNTWLEAQP
jgi:TolA-binding protein